LALLAIAGCSSRNPDEQQRSLDRVHQDKSCADAVGFYEPETGVVSSEAIAKEVAYRYLKSAYPTDRHLRPMTASLKNGVWTVSGSMPKNAAGGVAAIELCQSNGRVLVMSHGQ